MNKRNMPDSFWITNITRKAHHLHDIGVMIYPMRSLNLLDNKHYNLTRVQLEKSKESGSLFKKQDAVVVRKVAPEIAGIQYIPFKENAMFPYKQRSAVEVENIKYEELNVSDDTYAADNADMAQTDHLGKWNKK